MAQGQSNNSLNVNSQGGYPPVGTPPLPPNSQGSNSAMNNGSFKGPHKQPPNNRNANQSTGLLYSGSAGLTFFGGNSGVPLVPN